MECLNCQKPYTQRTATHKFCCKECNSAHRRANQEPCCIEGCTERAVTISMKLCHFHHRRYEAGLSLEVERWMAPKGSGTSDKKGYTVIRVNGVAKFEHRMVVEKALGKPLPREAHVHHLNGKKWDNRPVNLVVCPDDAYHRLLHKRAEELGIVFE